MSKRRKPIIRAAFGVPSGGQPRAAFTLIELSIVLVIIGLLVGGVLVGQDLIRAAEVRATISQIDKFNTAVNTFYGKYNALPGDMNAATAAQFGFPARGQYPGEGDGNGVIEGIYCDATPCNWGSYQAAGETVMFWVDLSKVGLIEGSFNTASSTIPVANPVTATTTPNIGAYLPPAKLGKGTYIHVWSGGWESGGGIGTGDGINYYGLTAVTEIENEPAGASITSTTNLTVQQAYAIDKKMDDGFPQSGSVIAMYHTGGGVGNPPSWAGSGGITSAPYTTATAGSPTTCFDNGNSAGSPQQYSVEISGGAGVNCALSFRFQ